MLARLRPDAQELSLCFDPTSDAIGDFEEGEALFDGDQPTEFTKGILQFNEAFEQAGGRTQAFIKELKELDLLMVGVTSIQPEGADGPFIYRAFQMIDAKNLPELTGDQLRKDNQNGLLPLLYALLSPLPL